jgi:hypothetical protein
MTDHTIDGLRELCEALRDCACNLTEAANSISDDELAAKYLRSVAEKRTQVMEQLFLKRGWFDT